MRWLPGRSPTWGTLVAAIALAGLTGCSHGAHDANRPSATSRPAGSPTGPSSAPPGAIGLSPAGVTTRVDVPAESTEEEYYQACHAAKLWMDAQPKTGRSMFEPYLAMLQAAPSGTPGSWDTRWSDLSLARQAAVITAARAAASDECG